MKTTMRNDAQPETRVSVPNLAPAMPQQPIAPREVRAIGDAPQPPASPAYPNLAKALAAARSRCKAAARDGYNKHHKYVFTKSDTRIAIAKEALQESGIGLIPVLCKLKTLGDSKLTIYSLHRVMLVVHESGESCPIEVQDWPIKPRTGMDIDKAFPGALTESLAYLLRDLLQMPSTGGEEEEEEAAAREDRPQPEATFEQVVTRAAPLATEQQVYEINLHVRQLGYTPQQIDLALAARKVDSIDRLTEPQAAEMLAGLEAKLAARPTPPPA